MKDPGWIYKEGNHRESLQKKLENHFGLEVTAGSWYEKLEDIDSVSELDYVKPDMLVEFSKSKKFKEIANACGFTGLELYWLVCSKIEVNYGHLDRPGQHCEYSLSTQDIAMQII